MTEEKEISGRLYDFKQLEEIAAADPAFIVSLANVFIVSMPPTSAELVEAAYAANWDTVGKLAHRLKSTVDSMNMHSITKDIRTLEQNAKQNKDTHLLAPLAKKVHNTITEAARQLQQEFLLD